LARKKRPQSRVPATHSSQQASAPPAPQGQPQQVGLEFAGPLPPPNWLQGYEQIVPGAAGRLLTLAEEEAKYRRQQGRSYARYRFVSLIAAFLLAAAVLVAGIWFVAIGKSVAGLTLLVVEVTALAAVFLGRLIFSRED
jgi:uncharacterized membrane protein